MKLLGSEPTVPNARVVLAGGVAVLVEPGRGVTELRDPRVHHPLEVLGASDGGAGDLALVARDGIHRFVPGAPPRPWWRGRDPNALTPTALDGDRLLVAPYRRWWPSSVALIERGAKRWSRRGVPDAHPVGEALVVSWQRYRWWDPAAGLSLVDLATGRDRWRVTMRALVAAIAAHPAQPAAAKLVIKLRSDGPSPPRWGPRWVGAVANRGWFVWDANDLGSFLFGLDLATGALVAATPLQTVAPSGHLVGTRMHLLTAGRYELFDLARDGVKEMTVHPELPTLGCQLRQVLDDGRALLVSRTGHLLLVDPREPKATRVLLELRDHHLGQPVVSDGRVHVTAHPFDRFRDAILAVVGLPEG